MSETIGSSSTYFFGKATGFNEHSAIPAHTIMLSEVLMKQRIFTPFVLIFSIFFQFAQPQATAQTQHMQTRNTGTQFDRNRYRFSIESSSWIMD
jgi:hypothetical protein